MLVARLIGAAIAGTIFLWIALNPWFVGNLTRPFRQEIKRLSEHKGPSNLPLIPPLLDAQPYRDAQGRQRLKVVVARRGNIEDNRFISPKSDITINPSTIKIGGDQLQIGGTSTLGVVVGDDSASKKRQVDVVPVPAVQKRSE